MANTQPQVAELASALPTSESEMTFSVEFPGHSSPSRGALSDARPAKRARTDAAMSNGRSDRLGTFIRRHPLGIRPSGNGYTSHCDLKDSCGSFALLSDELLVQFLGILEAPDLLRLGSTCRALYAFTNNDELWRALFVQ